MSERHLGRLNRQFLALVGGMKERVTSRRDEVAEVPGGVNGCIEELQPEAHGTLLYGLYEVLSGTPVAGIQLDHATADELVEWLAPYQELPYEVLGTLSDGEKAIITALKTCWPDAPRQRCQEHYLGNLADPVLAVDRKVQEWMRDELGGLPAVPIESEIVAVGEDNGPAMAPPL